MPNSIQDEEMSQWEKRVLVMLAYILLVGLLTLFCWHLESCLNKLRETFCPETCPTPFRLRHHGRMSGGYRRRRRRRRRRSSSSSSSSSPHEKIASKNGNPKEDTMTNVVTIIWRWKFYARCPTALVVLRQYSVYQFGREGFLMGTAQFRQHPSRRIIFGICSGTKVSR